MTTIVLLCQGIVSSEAAAFWSRYRIHIHQGITGAALSRGYEIDAVTGLSFSPRAIERINAANLAADVEPSASLAHWHFDDESMHQSYVRVLELRNAMVRELSQPADEIDEEQVWLQLGYALHAIQDFYSHSTWVDHGRNTIFGFDAAMRSSARVPAELARSAREIGNTCEDGVHEVIPGSRLTTGYYREDPDPGREKCRHGSLVRGGLACGGLAPSGINKDTPCQPLYGAARVLASRETVDFAAGLIRELEERGAIGGACVLMGLDDEMCPGGAVELETLGLCSNPGDPELERCQHHAFPEGAYDHRWQAGSKRIAINAEVTSSADVTSLNVSATAAVNFGGTGGFTTLVYSVSECVEYRIDGEFAFAHPAEPGGSGMYVLLATPPPAELGEFEELSIRFQQAEYRTNGAGAHFEVGVPTTTSEIEYLGSTEGTLQPGRYVFGTTYSVSSIGAATGEGWISLELGPGCEGGG